MNFKKDYLAPIAVLGAICLIISGLLAYTYELTLPVIQENARKEQDAGRLEVLPSGDSFVQVEMEMPQGGIDAYEAENGAGMVIQSSAGGYGGPYEIMVGITADGSIEGLKVMKQSETPGMGSRTTEPDHLAQFIGKDQNLEGVQDVSGATISSGALKSAIGTAFQIYGIATGAVEAPQDPKVEIFPDVAEFTPITVDGAVEAFKAEDAGVIIVTQADGFGGPLTVMTGFAPDGTIAGVRVTESSETAGLGSRVGEAAFTDLFVGKTSVDGIEGIAGASISSKAMFEAITAAVGLFPVAAA